MRFSAEAALAILLPAAPLAAAEPFPVAPELDGGRAWVNSAPVSLAGLRGKVVLLDFWTSSCVNCLHVLPDIGRLRAEFPDTLSVVGVHMGKFPHEASAVAVEQAVRRHRVRYPVVNDGDRKIWTAYGVKGWPTQVLIDPEGRIAQTVSGEGHFETLRKGVQEIVAAAEAAGTLVRSSQTVAEPATHALTLLFPGKVAADAGRLFVADTGHHRVLVLSHDGIFLDAIGSGVAGSTDGAFAEARLRDPQGIFPKGNLLYIADTGNHMVRVADLGARTLKTVAGTGQQMLWWGEGGPALQTPLSSPWDVCMKDDRLFVAMAGAHQVWVIDLEAGKASPYAGSGVEDVADGMLTEAHLAQPEGLTVDREALFVADSEGSAIRLVDTIERKVKTVAGRKKGKLQHPRGVHASDGSVYVADTFNHRVRVMPAGGGELHTLAGTGAPGKADGAQPSFEEPGGLWATGGRLYVADTGNHAVRVIDTRTGHTTTLTLTGVP